MPKTLADKLKDVPVASGPKPPLWKGPEEDGITQSLLARFLVCRERFRVHVMEGLRPAERFNHRLEYGSMWHVCEEALAKQEPGYAGWEDCLRAYATLLCRRHPTQQGEVDHWYNVCRVQFPLYVEHWFRHPDVVERTPLLQEQVFDVPHRLPSGRTVRLRGKWDSVDLVGKGKAAGIVLKENKTKGDVDEGQLKRQLAFDLQSGFYLVALREASIPIRDLNKPFPGYNPDTTELTEDQLNGLFKKAPIVGVNYNVVRRPLSGGAGSIRQHKPTKSNPQGESKAAFYARLSGIIRDSPESYFMRWQVGVTAGDLERFRREFLDPILEQLCDWWEHIQHVSGPDDPDLWGGNVHPSVHWRSPFGIFNPLTEDGGTDLDEYLNSGSTAGLQRADTLFPELS